MLIKRDFDMPLVVQDIESRQTGTRWLTRMKNLRKRRQTSGEPNCENTIEEFSTEKLPAKHDDRISECEITENPQDLSTIRDLDVITPLPEEDQRATNGDTELQDLSLAEIPSLTRARSLAAPTPRDPLFKLISKRILKFLISLISPPAIACLSSLTIALVPQLKALFVPDVPGVNMPDAPDGTPPLAWILDIATFGGIPSGFSNLTTGGASVPTGLVILGASLSGLSLRNKKLPPWYPTSTLYLTVGPASLSWRF